MSDCLKGKRIVDSALTSVTHGYKSAVFIDERIFPVVLTDKEGVRVPTFGRAVFVEYDTERAVGTNSNVLVREKAGTLDLVLGEHDLAAPVDYCEQAESMFDKESKAIRRATNDINLRRELTAARLVQNEKVYRIGHVKKLTVNDRQINGKGGLVGMIEADIEAIHTATGLRPNLMTMGVGVMVLLKFRPAIQAAIGASERKHITTEILRDLFQIRGTVIGAPVSLPPMKAVIDKNSVSADIWGNNLTLYYVGKPQPGAGSADGNESSFGYILRRKGTPVADEYDEAGGKAKYCRYTDTYKVAMVGGGAGYLTTGISR